MDFKDFLTEADDYEKDLKATLKKLPKKHQKLVAGYKFLFQPTNALNGDPQHIGVIDSKKKTITISAPWNYGREYTLLHEMGHLVWSTLNSEIQRKWKSVVRSYPPKDKPKQSDEEYFSMAYANTYANNKIEKFCIPTWHSFIKAHC